MVLGRYDSMDGGGRAMSGTVGESKAGAVARKNAKIRLHKIY
jgi:hypothetical protein